MSDRAIHLLDVDSRVQTFGKVRLIRAGMAEVTQLNAIIKNKYARTPDQLRAWQSASHIERAPQREKKPAPVNGGTTPPAPGQ